MMRITDFQKLLRDRVLVLDGAMGTMIQKFGLDESDFRGNRFAHHPVRLAGCNDLLILTRPDVIRQIHKAYLDAGADIISTDTFNANAISMADYDLQAIPGLIREINREGASIARKAAEESAVRKWGRHALVAGSVGPTNKAATMSPDVSDPAGRNISYDELHAAYLEQIEGLLEGGADLLLFETVFDTLNLKAGLDAAVEAMEMTGNRVPILVSATVSDKSGRTLSGQTLQAFATSIEDYECVVSLGLNCSFGPKDIIAPLRNLGKATGHFITTHPNAGLPDALGQYDVNPEIFIEQIQPILSERLVNIIGGCCGTTPEHIAKLRDAADKALPYEPRQLDTALRVSGLERVEVKPENNFLIVGERCNVAGSRKFLRLVKEKNYDEAMSIAVKQVEDGAMVIDINMDDPLLDAPAEMQHFLRLYASDPAVAKAPVMIDSSDWNVVETALKNLQGKSIVNSISLKEGEEAFLRMARSIRRLGAAVVVMAFDETGQADTYERKIEVCQRAYGLLTEKCGFKGEDIIFDVNVMAVATGLEEHARYGIDFIKAVEWVKSNLPGARTSGGISNLSFAFRGRNALREAMHSVFLYHAIAAGLDMAIMNPASALTYDDIDPQLRSLIEDVILARRPEAGDILADYATEESAAKTRIKDKTDRNLEIPVARRIEDAIVAGRSDFLFEDLDEISKDLKGVDIVEGPLMAGMRRVGDLFGEGRMFLPQVVKTARVMKMAVDHLAPNLMSDAEEAGDNKAGKVLLATVKGDVHDIGKNIVSIVLACNNFDIIDLGVMVPAESIVETALRERPDIICLSGLITPSLAEMTATAEALRKAGLDTPLLVGGATTSALHTALKIAPVYDGPVVHMKDASQNPIVASRLLNPELKGHYIASLNESQNSLRESYMSSQADLIPLETARMKGHANRINCKKAPIPSTKTGTLITKAIDITELEKYINWKMLLHAWGLHRSGCPCGCDSGEEARKLIADTRTLISEIAESGKFDGFGIVKIVEANSVDDDLIIDDHRIPTLRQQYAGSGFASVADFIHTEGDYAGVFMAGAGQYIDDFRRHLEADGESYRALLCQSLADRLAEAASEYLHYLVRTDIWGYSSEKRISCQDDITSLFRGEYQGIRPAMGYPMLPDQLLNHEIFDILRPAIGDRVRITENGAMSPTSTVSGIYIANPDSRYFTIGAIDNDQITDYSARRGLTEQRIREILNQ